MLREIFTWWNGKTLGTMIWSYYNGILVGSDDQGNKYYKNKKDTKRWVIYNGIVESTNINPEWNNWLRYTSSQEPGKFKKYSWQIKHSPNLTGTNEAYDPEISRKKNKQVVVSDDYKKWSPED